jgi:hypothetical protein
MLIQIRLTSDERLSPPLEKTLPLPAGQTRWFGQMDERKSQRDRIQFSNNGRSGCRGWLPYGIPRQK